MRTSRLSRCGFLCVPSYLRAISIQSDSTFILAVEVEQYVKCCSGLQRVVQAALLKEFENLPLMFETDSETLKGHAELLNHITRLIST